MTERFFLTCCLLLIVSVSSYGYVLPQKNHHIYVMVVELVFGLTSFFAVLHSWVRQIESSKCYLQVASFAALMFGDLLMNTRLARLTTGSWIEFAGFSCYLVLAITFPVFVWKRYRDEFWTREKILILTVAAVSMALAALQLKYVVLPLESGPVVMIRNGGHFPYAVAYTGVQDGTYKKKVFQGIQG